MNVAIVTDNASGFSDIEIKNLGLHIIPLKFYFDDNEYLDTKLSDDDFFNLLQKSKQIKTTQPSVYDVTNTFDELLKYYEVILYLPITSGLSGTYSTGATIANDDKYKDRVVVVDHKKVSVTQKFAIYDAIKLLNKGYNPFQVKKILEDNQNNFTIYLMVDTLEYLKKGGRISPLVANVGELLQIKPILYTTGGSFEMTKKSRTVQKAKEIMIDCLLNDMRNKFNDDNYSSYSIGVAYSKNIDIAKEFKKEVEEIFYGISRQVLIDPLAKFIACHTGPNALGIGLYKNLDEC